MTENDPGFSQENLERIYLGKPALADGEPVEELLTDKQYETATMIAEGLQYSEIAELTHHSISTIRTHVSEVYGRLDLYSKFDLPAFFPIVPDEQFIHDRKLGDLSLQELRILEKISTGRPLKAIANELCITKSTVRTHLCSANNKWPECVRSINLLRAANGMRANYAANFAENGSTISNMMGGFALDKLVNYEPRIRSILGLPGGPDS